LCLSTGEQPVAASNLYDVGPLLQRVGRACLAAKATPILVHHATKAASKTMERAEPLDLGDLAYSGIGEYARQWILLARRGSYVIGTGKHRLLMNVGGSAGHSGCWDVDVKEGVVGDDFEGREWQVTVHRSEGRLGIRKLPKRSSFSSLDSED